MAKNYKNIYEAGADSSAIDQRFYLRVETEKGEFATPQDGDFFYHMGGTINHEQPFEASKQKSGRHNVTTIRKKETSSWTLSTYINQNDQNGVDEAIKTLLLSLLGNRTGDPVEAYDSSVAPNVSFSLLEVSDLWSRQSPGSFVQGATFKFPGDGESMIEWSGSSKTTQFAGIGKIQSVDGSNLVLEDGDVEQFTRGALVMLIKEDGVTRASDTPGGASRIIEDIDISQNRVRLSSDPIADAVPGDYLVYYEPERPVASTRAVIGLTGEFRIRGTVLPIRNFEVSVQNNHELHDYYYGTASLGPRLYSASKRLMIEPTVQVNVDKNVISMISSAKRFEQQNYQIRLGGEGETNLLIDLPKVQIKVPSFSVPDEGSIPIDFQGTALATSEDEADEIKISIIKPGESLARRLTRNAPPKTLKPKSSINTETFKEIAN